MCGAREDADREERGDVKDHAIEHEELEDDAAVPVDLGLLLYDVVGAVCVPLPGYAPQLAKGPGGHGGGNAHG